METPGAGKEAIIGHREIIDALKKGDERVIKKTVHNHIMRGKEILLEKVLNKERY